MSEKKVVAKDRHVVANRSFIYVVREPQWLRTDGGQTEKKEAGQRSEDRLESELTPFNDQFSPASRLAPQLRRCCCYHCRLFVDTMTAQAQH